MNRAALALLKLGGAVIASAFAFLYVWNGGFMVQCSTSYEACGWGDAYRASQMPQGLVAVTLGIGLALVAVGLVVSIFRGTAPKGSGN